jgi:hypothetical protein
MNTLDFLGRIRTRAARRRVESWIEARRGCFSQHDMDLANQAGAAYRSDNNSALGALVTLSSGATVPATTFAHMLWADTTSGTLKRRNAANTLWIVVRTLDESFVLSRSTNTLLDVSDIGKTIVATATFTQTFDPAANLGDGWWIGYRIESGATITFDPNAAENIDGAATKVIAGPTSGILACNGTAFFTIGFGIPASGGTITGALITSGAGTILGIGTGARMTFQQTTAPTGWTKELSTTFNDAGLRFMTGATSTGGATAFSTMFGTGKSTAGFTLTTAEIPAHTHPQESGTRSAAAGAVATLGAQVTTTANSTTQSTGGGGSHAHTLNNFDLKWVDCIIATKD